MKELIEGILIILGMICFAIQLSFFMLKSKFKEYEQSHEDYYNSKNGMINNGKTRKRNTSGIN